MWLALETATDRASVALGFPGAIAVEVSLTGGRRHAGALLPLLEDALRQSGAALDEIEGVVVADGPGSFTGLRVGASVAQALVRARGLPLWSAPSLMTMAAGAPLPPGAPVLAATDALRGEVYAALYRFRPGRVDTLLAPSVWRPAELVPHVAPAHSPAALVAIGPEPLLLPLRECCGGVMLPAAAAWPSAGTLLSLVGSAGGARRVADPARWEPEYGRPAEAQTQWELAHGRPLPHPSR